MNKLGALGYQQNPGRGPITVVKVVAQTAVEVSERDRKIHHLIRLIEAPRLELKGEIKLMDLLDEFLPELENILREHSIHDRGCMTVPGGCTMEVGHSNGMFGKHRDVRGSRSPHVNGYLKPRRIGFSI